jgi:hypothetical protein
MKHVITATGEAVTVESVAGGWSTVTTSTGETKKVRNGALSAIIQQEPKKMQAAIRTAAPAHFVRDVAPERGAKIKDTVFNLGKYFVSDIKTPSGRRTIDCADDVAATLRGMDLDQVYAVTAQALEIDEAQLRKQYEHLNQGMQRMNLGNRIRGAEVAKAQAQKKLEAAAERERLYAERAVLREAARADKERQAVEKKLQRQAEQAAKKAAKRAEAEVAIA